MGDSQDLKNAGLKATTPRLKILNLFETSDVRHLTAEDVYKILLADNEDVGLATVYRVLTQFEQAGLLIRHHFLGDDITLLDVDFVGRKLFANLVGHGTGGKEQNGGGSKCPQNGFHKNPGKKQ